MIGFNLSAPNSWIKNDFFTQPCFILHLTVLLFKMYVSIKLSDITAYFNCIYN